MISKISSVLKKKVKAPFLLSSQEESYIAIAKKVEKLIHDVLLIPSPKPF